MKQLVKTDNYFALVDPLLDYLKEVCNHFWPDFEPERYDIDGEGNISADVWGDSMFPQRFADRFFLHVISTDREQKFLDSEEVQDTLKAFDLDAEKFWYLCLGIKDIVEGYTDSSVRCPKTAKEELRELEAELKSYVPTSEGSGELSFKVGKHPLKITNPKTFSILSVAIHDYLEKDTSIFEEVNIDFNDKVTLKPIYKIALFNRYMAWFLKDKVADNAINASKDKSLLISRMIFILGISDDESFFEEYREDGSKLDYLKNYIKKYKNIKITTHNVRYCSITPLGGSF